MTVPGTPGIVHGFTSEITLQFDPHYDPAAVDLKGQQLCSFCPVYRKKPVEVSLYLEPGLPTETLAVDCPDGNTTIQEFFWLGAWSIFHYADPNAPGHFPDWDLQNTPDLLAQKDVSNKGVDGNDFAVTEKTNLKLKPCSRAPTTDANGQQTCTDSSGSASSIALPKRRR